MSVKTTQRISRNQALFLLHVEIDEMPNDTIADLLDRIADKGTSKHLSYFDNFIVSNF